MEASKGLEEQPDIIVDLLPELTWGFGKVSPLRVLITRVVVNWGISWAPADVYGNPYQNSEFLPRPSNVVPFGVRYGFLVRTLIRTGTTLEGLGGGCL